MYFGLKQRTSTILYLNCICLCIYNTYYYVICVYLFVQYTHIQQGFDFDYKKYIY